MKTKINILRAISVLFISGIFFVSCQKSTESTDTTVKPYGDDAIATKITDIKANGYNAVYLTNTGYVYNANVSSSAYGSSIVKLKVRGLKNIIKIGCGPHNGIGWGEGYALDSDGKIYYWTFTAGQSDSAVVYTKMSTFTSKIIDIAVGGSDYSFIYALDQNKNVWGWGDNTYYQMGDNTTTYRSTPSIISGLPADVSALSAGSSQGIALSAGGNVYHWGRINWQANEVYRTAQMVVGVSSASAIGAGDNYNLAKKNDGSVFAWGHLTNGIVPGITSPAAMAAGAELYFNPMFITSDGTLMQTSFSMANGNPTQAEIVPSLTAYKFSLLSVTSKAFYVTKDGISILVQLSSQTTPLVLSNPF